MQRPRINVRTQELESVGGWSSAQLLKVAVAELRVQGGLVTVPNP
ncbi:MAG: hypothetical protein JWO63_52 [Frankiales bacterium]|jgi:hypothetical protein|nr:hypothetical protein [Frankiales bacterium]